VKLRLTKSAKRALRRSSKKRMNARLKVLGIGPQGERLTRKPRFPL
jgi:hypothetical protein